MKLFVGLGNPGREYESTRHNVGAKFIDFIAKEKSLTFTEKFKSLYAEANIEGEKFIFIKPQTFMNSSGSAVSEVKNFYKIPTENIYVIFDDLDIAQDSWKMQFAKYPKIHNGVNDIIEKLGTDKINFIRIGIDGRTQIEKDFVPGRDYVLQKTEFGFDEVFREVFNKLKIKN